MVSLVMCRKDFLLHGTCLQKTLQILTYFFDWLYLTQCLISFSSIDHPCLCAVFDSISSIIDEVLSINPCGNKLSFETLTSIIRTGLPILVELIFQVISVAIFLSHVNLLRWLIFLLGSWTVILTVLLFWIYLFLRRLVFVLQWFLLHWEILIMLLSQFSLSFHHIHNRLPCFIALLMNILMLIGTVFVII